MKPSNVALAVVHREDEMQEEQIGMDEATDDLFFPDDGYRMGPVVLDEEEVVNHLMFAGATGSGKTTLIRLFLQDVLPRLASYPDSRMLITNPKGDALSVLHGIQPNGVRIFTTDPFDARGVAWDMDRDINEPRTALQFAFTLLPKRAESQPFFTDAARHIIYGVLLSFLHRNIRWSFADLLRALQTPRTVKNILRASKFSKHILYSYFYDKRLASNILSTITANLLPFGPVAACWETAKEKFSIRDWVKSNDVLVMGSSDESRDALNVINRCMFRRVSDLLLALPESQSRRNFVVLDEASENKFDGLDSLLKRGRSKGTSVLIAFQSIAGLRAPEMYGPHRTAEIVGQIRHKSFGRVECPETAKWASEVFGEQEILQTTESRSRTSGANGTTTETKNDQIVTRSSVMASEFMDQTPCNAEDGLSAFYLSSLYGAFSANIPGGELFGSDLLPRCEKTEDFIPREVEAQFLEPWTDVQRDYFSPKPVKKLTKVKQASQDKAPTNESDIFTDLNDL